MLSAFTSIRSGDTNMSTTSYGTPFLVHTYFHHVTRLDHRHNFSPYNTLLYLNSALPPTSSLRIESLAFLPQIVFSCVLIPLAIAKSDLATCMMAQTFAFVTFNKVCTSQVRSIIAMQSLPPSSPNQELTSPSTSFGIWCSSRSTYLTRLCSSRRVWGSPLSHYGSLVKRRGCSRVTSSSSSANRLSFQASFSPHCFSSSSIAGFWGSLLAMGLKYHEPRPQRRNSFTLEEVV